MISPAKLNKGDKIGIIAPSRKISHDEIKAAIQVFENWGLQVSLGKNLFKKDRQFSGTDEEREEDLQYMLDDPEIKAIVCARGGYGTIRIVNLVDYTAFMKNPKWIVGYSDITALHAHLNQNLNVKSIHGIMPINFPDDLTENNSIRTLKKALFGEENTYEIAAHDFNRNGKAIGELIGGNLSVLYSISGTKFDIETDGKLLFIEDLDEYLYHIDRMMMNLKYSGKLENLNGLIVGGMADMNDNEIPFGKSAYEIIQDVVKDYSFPVCYDFPVGHTENNSALILGKKSELEIKDKSVVLKN
ncbi:MAG: LD-carboxypeptidase [Bacteroidales bacterium]|nr:LD-carboxypeptidase [Bacteroidales bacterium]